MNITVNGYDLSPAVISGVTEGTNSYERLTFTFDASWDGLIKTVTFYTPDRDVVCLVAEDTVLLPTEVTRQSGVTRYVICGTDGEKTVMSTEGAINIGGTLNVDEDTFERKTPGAIETITQYIKKITDAYDAAHANAENVAQMADSAERAASAAEDSCDGAVTAQKNAENFASRALGSAQSASSASDAAHTSAESAQSAESSARASAKSAQTAAEDALSASNAAHASSESATVSSQSAYTSAERAHASAERLNASADSAQSASDAAHASAESAIVSAQNAQTAAERAKAVYDFVAEREPVIGRFVNYRQSDTRARYDGWRILIRRIADERVCIRFEHEQFKGSKASRVLYLCLKSREQYMMQFYNDAPRGFFDYRIEGSSTPLSAGATDWYFDSEAGYLEVCLDTAAVAEISQTKEFTIVSALITDYSGNCLTEIKQIHFLDGSGFAATPIRKVKSVSASADSTSVTVDSNTDNGQFDLSEFYARVTFKRPSGDTTENPIKFLVTGASSPIELPIGSASEKSFFIHGEASEDMLFISLLPENGVAGCVFTAVTNGIRSFEISRLGDSKFGEGTTVDIWGRYAERM